jgi:nitroimidazol reductase NimA-like FMN-containing flavoprotein (pyridoxamine 5'-phosphate oxidase superfamily)
VIPRRKGDLAPLDRDECLERLADAPFVRLGFCTADGPSILPVNHLLLGDLLYFRTETGTKLATAAAEGKVAVEADGHDESRRLGWSVLGHGHASIVTDDAELERLHSHDFTPWTSPDSKLFWIRVAFEDLEGRRIVSGSSA